MKNSNEVFFPTLEAEIARRGIPKKEIEKAIGVAHVTFTRKLNGERKFTLDDIVIICKMFPDIPFLKLFETAANPEEPQDKTA